MSDGAIELSKSVPIVVPPLDQDKILEHFKKIQQLKQRLVDPDKDIIQIGGKPYILKSGWRKLAFAFNLTDEILREEKEITAKGTVWRMWIRVIAPNGRSVTAVASASSDERKFNHPDHDSYSLCHTRAKNRGISDLLGLGEVSAEEMDAPSQERPVSPPQATPEGEPDPISSLPWLESSANWLPPDTLYIFGDTEGAEELADTMRRTPDLRAVINGRLYRFSFGKGGKGSETFINAIPVGEGSS